MKKIKILRKRVRTKEPEERTQRVGKRNCWEKITDYLDKMRKEARLRNWAAEGERGERREDREREDESIF